MSQSQSRISILRHYLRRSEVPTMNFDHSIA